MSRLPMCCLLASLLSFAACGTIDPTRTLATAGQHARAGKFENAFDALRVGLREPSLVLRDDAFRQLLDDRQWRPRVRELLKEHACETSIRMTRADQPGEPMILTIHVVGEDDGRTAYMPPRIRPGVLVGIAHTDADGYYQPWTGKDDWNPRLFGFAVTDATGTVVVETIRPGYYAQEYESPNEARHVHFNIEQNGYLLRAAEFVFADDPRVTHSGAEGTDATPIASVHRGTDGIWRTVVTIPVLGLRH